MKGLTGNDQIDARIGQAGMFGRSVAPLDVGIGLRLRSHGQVRLDRDDLRTAPCKEPRRDSRAGADIGDRQLRRIGLLCEISERDRAVGAGDTHNTIVDLEVGRAGFERFGRDLAKLRAKLAGRPLDADAAGRNRARTTGAEA